MPYVNDGTVTTLLYTRQIEPLHYDVQRYRASNDGTYVFGTLEHTSDAYYRGMVFALPPNTAFNYPDVSTQSYYDYGLSTGDASTIPPEPSDDNMTLNNRGNAPIGGGIISMINPPTTQSYAYISSTIPLFDFNDLTSIQNYIDNGDDSGALNYNELHAPHIDYTLWIDGTKNPALHLTADVIQGDVTGHSVTFLCSNGIQYNPFASQFSEGCVYTWEQLRSYSKVLVSMPIVQVKIHPIYGTLDQPEDEVRALVNSSAEYSGVHSPSDNGKNTLTIRVGEPEDTVYDDSTDTYEDVDNAVILGKNVLNRTYKISSTDLQSLGDFLFSAGFVDNIQLANNNPIENILSIKNMPTNISGTSANVVIGNVDTGITADVISGEDAIAHHINVGSFHIPRQLGNFLDFTSVSMGLYLPFIGFKPLSTAFYGLTLGIDYYLDSTRGECLCVLSNVKSNGNKIPLDCYQGCCGADISITASNKARREAGILMNALEGAGDIATGNYGGAVNSVGSAMLSEHTTHTTGLGSGALMSAMTRDVFIIFDSPKSFDAKGFGTTKGYIHYEWNTIGSFEGFSKFENVDLEGLECTAKEIEMISAELEKGVIL